MGDVTIKFKPSQNSLLLFKMLSAPFCYELDHCDLYSLFVHFLQAASTHFKFDQFLVIGLLKRYLCYDLCCVQCSLKINTAT